MRRNGVGAKEKLLFLSGILMNQLKPYLPNTLSVCMIWLFGDCYTAKYIFDHRSIDLRRLDFLYLLGSYCYSPIC